MATALVLGGTGQIGRPSVRRLEAHGFDVTVAARNPAPDMDTRFVRVDRSEPGALERAAQGFDVLVDIMLFTAAEAREVATLAGSVGSVVWISSGAVYGLGPGYPPLPVPITESLPCIAPVDEGTYAERKRAIELILAESDLPSTAIRASAIYGPRTTNAREFYFVKRALDGRPHVVLANEGRGHFHTVSAENIAELVRLAAAAPADRMVNGGDPDPPTAIEICRTIASVMGHEWRELLLPGPAEGTLGSHPWNLATPFILDMGLAERELGYRPVTTYPEAVRATVEWMVDAVRDRPWREVFTGSPYLETMFDYEAEDAYAASLASISGGL